MKIAKELGYEIIFGDSNAMDVVRQNHYLTHTYSSMFAVFCLQKLFLSTSMRHPLPNMKTFLS